LGAHHRDTVRLVVIVLITVLIIDLIIVLVVHCHSIALQYFGNFRVSFSRGTCCQHLVVIVACSFTSGFLHQVVERSGPTS
jgi:hypothetical protein